MNLVAHKMPAWLDMSRKAWQYPRRRSGLGRARNCSHLTIGEYCGLIVLQWWSPSLDGEGHVEAEKEGEIPLAKVCIAFPDVPGWVVGWLID